MNQFYMKCTVLCDLANAAHLLQPVICSPEQVAEQQLQVQRTALRCRSLTGELNVRLVNYLKGCVGPEAPLIKQIRDVRPEL